MRQISHRRESRALRGHTINALATHLETNTRWGKFMARPAQIKAGARKLHDVLMGQARRERKQAVRG